MKKFLAVCAGAALLLTESLLANLLRNADFEAGPAEAEIVAFHSTPGWYNPVNAGSKKALAVNARAREGDAEGSTYSATVNDREKEISYFVQKTEHSIAEGEIFELSLDWKAGWQWQAQDVLRVVVFAKENNNLGGETVWEETVDFEFAPTSWEKVTHVFPPAPLQATAKTLFFSFYGVDPQQAGVAGFARVDNIVLTAKPE